jgi:hypothetical protein
MTTPVIKLAILISYDYAYIYHSLPLLYEAADEITIAIDQDRITWSGKPFLFDEKVIDWIRSIDTSKKIKIYEDHFYKEGLTTMQNDTRERTMVAEFMGDGGWHVQIDADEYFPEFKKFVQYLKEEVSLLENAANDPVDVYLFWTTLFKQTDTGFVYIKDSAESFPAATNKPVYTAARQTGSRPHYANFVVFHQSWARTPEEIGTKINNWSHSADFNVADYFTFWQSVNESNYRLLKNIHPVTPKAWKKLGFIPSKDVTGFITNFLRKHKPRLSWFTFRGFKKQERRIKKRLAKG